MIRSFTLDDYADFYKIRLEALQTNPEAFLTKAEEFAARPKEFNLGRFNNSVTSPDHIFKAAYHEHEICGMAGFRHYEEPLRYTGQVWGVFISARARGTGMGSKLMRAIIDEARQMDCLTQIQLGVYKNNAAAIKLYEKLGFETFIPPANDPIMDGACSTERHMVLKL